MEGDLSLNTWIVLIPPTNGGLRSSGVGIKFEIEHELGAGLKITLRGLSEGAAAQAGIFVVDLCYYGSTKCD
jgi:hypothetical protein